MAIDKPSGQESEYFAKLDAEKRKKMREQLDKKRHEEQKSKQQETHWMKCPKCGHDLQEIKFRDIAIDECKTCGGIWLDHGELELLLKSDAKEAVSFFDRFFTKKNK